MTTSAEASVIGKALLQRRLPSGGWSFFSSEQASVEATCLAGLALGPDSHGNAVSTVRFLKKSQLSDGGWPAFQGDSEGAWTTALALCALTVLNEISDASNRALKWLLESRGKEGHWFWRWKFKIADRNVRFDPDKYGWPWSSGFCKLGHPHRFQHRRHQTIHGLQSLRASEKRIRLGVDMLLDRACVGGGWNSGNSIVYGVPLPPHVEATAIALLALQDEERTPVIRMSLAWLKQRSATIESVESLAWSILALFVYQEPVDHLKARLATLIGDGRDIRNNATLATAILALRCGEMIHPFMVLR